jgi:hypothetical protein
VLVAAAVCLHFWLFDWESRQLRRSPYAVAPVEAFGVWPTDDLPVSTALTFGAAVPLLAMSSAAYLSRQQLAIALGSVLSRLGASFSTERLGLF